jgi:hypothetical protein
VPQRNTSGLQLISKNKRIIENEIFF